MPDLDGPARNLDQHRKALDDAEEVRRAKTDTDRAAQRALHDRTRQHRRGDSQAHESLERERRDGDASLKSERADTTRQRRAERAHADKLASTQTGARDSAEEALDACELLAGDRTRELRAAMRSTTAELKVISGLVDGIRKETPALQEPAQAARVSTNANAIAASVERLQRLLQSVLDRDDAGAHDVGGSG